MQDLKKFTDFITELKMIQAKKSLNFPRAVLLGSLKSGKTSLLQCILGMNLFPNGCHHKLSYLEIELKTTENLSGYIFELQNTQEKFYEIDSFRRRLSAFVSNLRDNYQDSVTIGIYSNLLPYLTLIDLPGLAEIGPEATDEAFLEQESLKKKFVKKMVKDEKTLIICVLSATDNFKDSRALDYAREYDPQGERTLGVITKYDLLNSDSQRGEIGRILNGKDSPLKHGYTLLEPTTAFRNLLEDDPEHHHVFEDRSADQESSSEFSKKFRSPQIEQFLFKFKKVFCFSIRTIFPSLFNEFQAKAKEFEEDLEDLGEDLDVENADVFRILWKTASNFCVNFRDALSGSYMGIEKGRKKKTTLACGAYIRNLLHSLYMEADYYRTFKDFSYTDEEIIDLLKNHNAVTLEGFISTTAFKLMVADRLQYLENPAYEIFEKIFEALVHSSKTLLEKHFSRLPDLKIVLEEFLGDYFLKEKLKTLEILKPLLKAQLYYVYCNDPEKIFQNVHSLSRKGSESQKPLTKAEAMDLLVQELKESCKIYCETVMFSLRDCLPKIIGQFFLDEISNNIQVFLTDHIKKTITQNPEVLKLTQYQKEQRNLLLSKLKIVRKLKQYIIQDSTLCNFLRDPNLEETIFNKYQRRKNSYFKRVEEAALKLQTQRKAELEAQKKANEKKTWTDRFKNWFKERSKRKPRFGRVPDNTSINTQQVHVNRFNTVKDFMLEEETIIVASRARANSLDMKDDNQKVNKNTLITDFVLIDNYYNTDQQTQGKLLSKTDWMKLITKGDMEGVPTENQILSLKNGIPNEMRASIWTVLAQVKKLKARHPKFLYERLSKMPSKWDDLILKDVPRTRNQDSFFKKPEYMGTERLTRVLKAYASYDPELGYTQGMNEIAGVILMVMSNYNQTSQFQDMGKIPKSSEKNTFWILVYMMKEKGYRESFKDDCPKLIENLLKFEKILKEENPAVLDHMEASGVTVHSAFTHLFMTLACQGTPFEFSIRIFDVFLVAGEKVLFDVLLKVIGVCRKEIFSLRDDKLFGFFKHDIMHICFEKYKRELNKLLPDF